MQTLKFHNPESSGLVSVIIPTRNGERLYGFTQNSNLPAKENSPAIQTLATPQPNVYQHNWAA
jgi:hypothetical protein